MKLVMINPQKLEVFNAIRELHGGGPIEPVKDAIDEILKHFNVDVPTGSEGLVKIAMHVWPTTEDFDKIGGTTHIYKGSLYWADILISGDLRDFDNPKSVAAWLMKRTENLPEGVGLRDGTLLAYSEDGKSYSMHNDGDDWKRTK